MLVRGSSGIPPLRARLPRRKAQYQRHRPRLTKDSPSPLNRSPDVMQLPWGVRSPNGAPTGFWLRLNRSPTAFLTWESLSSQLGYVLLTLPQGGAPRTSFASAWTNGWDD